MQYKKPELEERISNMLLLNASFITNVGLMHGKMGISIYFYHLARKTNNKIYEEFAGELLDEIFSEINSRTSQDFENGLTGIGWGIEYLVKNGFVEADTNEVLADIDNFIYADFNNNPPIELNLLKGILGTVLYSIRRLKSATSGSQNPQIENHKRIIVQFIERIDTWFERIDKSQQYFANHSFICDLSWDYLVLLFILADLDKLNIAGNKVARVLEKMVLLLQNEGTFPALTVNRILLAVALERISDRNTPNVLNREDITGNHALNNTISLLTDKLLKDIHVATISDEISETFNSIDDCIIGNVLIHDILFNITGIQAKRLVGLWNEVIQNLNRQEAVHNWFDLEQIKDEGQMGLLKGIAGIGFQMSLL